MLDGGSKRFLGAVGSVWQCIGQFFAFRGPFFLGKSKESELQEKSRTPKCEARASKSAGIIGKALQNVEIWMASANRPKMAPKMGIFGQKPL